MFAFGGAVLWGLYLAPRARSPVSPPVRWAAPTRPLRFVSIDCAAGGDGAPTPEQVVAGVRPLDADFVMLQRVRSEDAVSLAEGLGMQRTFHPQCFQALGTRPRGAVGCLILSKHPVYEAQPVRHGARDAPCVGVRVVAVVDRSRFAIVSAAPTTVPGSADAWRGDGIAPTVAGVADAGGAIVADARWAPTRAGTAPLPRSSVSIRWADFIAAGGTIEPSTKAVQ
jgi:hypothetical protein